MNLTFNVKSYFNSKPLINRIGKARARALSKIGAFVRNTARQSLRPGKKSAAPGQPPKVHTKIGLKVVEFAYDESTKSVVVGPVKFAGKSAGRRTIPNVIEQGGEATVTLRRKNRTVRVRAKYAPHPWMGPALEKERANPKLMDSFKDAL